MAKTKLGEPGVDEGIGSITYTWPDVGIEVSALRLRDEGRAELWFFHRNGQGKRNLLHVAEVNLLASATMTGLAKRMAIHGDLPWTEIMTDVTSKTMVYLRQGEPGIVIEPHDGLAIHPGYYVEPVIMKGVPNIIFGDKGVSKTTICLMLLGLLQLAEGSEIYGLKVCGPTKIALLDWEANKALTEYTISRLIKGGQPWFNLPYLRGKQSLPDDIERVIKFLAEHKPDVVLIDSLGQAAGSDKYDSAGKGAALRFFEALRRCNVTSMIIAQNAKGEDQKKTIYGSTFFTYYARNIFELRRAESLDPNEMSIALFHMESNYSKRYDPIGFQLKFTDETITIEREAVNLAQFSERISQSRRILDFLADGSKSVTAIATHLGTSNGQVSVALYRLKKAEKVVSLGSGSWGLSERLNNA